MPFLKRGAFGELLDWHLVSEHPAGHTVIKVFEAQPECFNHTYRMEVIYGLDIDAQHLSFQ